MSEPRRCRHHDCATGLHCVHPVAPGAEWDACQEHYAEDLARLDRARRSYEADSKERRQQCYPSPWITPPEGA